MRHIIVTFFCSFLSPGHLQALNDANNQKVQSDSGSMGPVHDEQIWPVQAYQTFGGNFFGTARRSINPKPCVRQSSLDGALEQPINNQPTPPPTRRSSISEDYNALNVDSVNRPQSIKVKELNKLGTRHDSEEIVEVSELPKTENEFYRSKIEESNPTDELPEQNYLINTPPAIKSEKEGSSNFQEPTDELSTLAPVAAQQEELQPSKIQCSNKRDPEVAEPPRRFLSPVNKVANHEKNRSTKSKEIFRSFGNNKYNSKHISRTKSDLESDEYDDSDMDSSEGKPSSAARSSVTDQRTNRAGTVHFVVDQKIKDPAHGSGLSPMKKTTLMLMDFDRSCYACNSANNPTCLKPDRRTTVKYCRKGDTGCVTKTFGDDNSLSIVRDCGKSCDDFEPPNGQPRYRSCSICHKDLCNSAYSIKIHDLILTIPLTFVLIALVKPLL